MGIKMKMSVIGRRKRSCQILIAAFSCMKRACSAIAIGTTSEHRLKQAGQIMLTNRHTTKINRLFDIFPNEYTSDMSSPRRITAMQYERLRGLTPRYVPVELGLDAITGIDMYL